MTTDDKHTESVRPAVVILAAGKGTRMKSDLPKVLHQLGGRPMLAHVVELAERLDAVRTVVVVGWRADLVERAFTGHAGLSFAIQEPQLGTGHAVMAAAPQLDDFDGPVLVLCGDVPGLTDATVRGLLAQHGADRNQLTVLGMDLAEPGAYGRLVTDGGELLRIVEYRDAGPAERAVRLVNAGIYVFQAGPLLQCLRELRPENDQQEYYLTDLVEIFRGHGYRVGWALCADPAEVAGINSQEQLAEYNRRLACPAG